MTFAEQLSDLESLASFVDNDMTEYDQSKIDELSAKAKAVADAVEGVFGCHHLDIGAIINNARCVSDTNEKEWRRNRFMD